MLFVEMNNGLLALTLAFALTLILFLYLSFLTSLSLSPLLFASYCLHFLVELL